jgi:hypothetical protein
MARRSNDEYSNSSDARSRDLTAQFWGSSPSWRTTGTLRRTRRGGERTGPIARTRRHGDPTGQTPVVPVAPIDEPHIDPYDFGFDDVGYGPYVDTGTGIDTRRGPSVRSAIEHQPEPVDLIELEERRAGGPVDAISKLADRLGLGAIDPLLLRLGVIVLIGVLLVPLAMTLRPDSSKGSVHTETTAAPSTELIVSGDAAGVKDAAGVEDAPGVEAASGVEVAPALGAGSGDSAAPALKSSDEPAAAPTPSPAAVAAEQPESTSGGDIAEPAGESGSDVGATVEASQAMAQGAIASSEADEPVDLVAPACHLSYTIAAGDYWIRLADATGTKLAKLLQANVATIRTPLYPGDDICLPEGATLPAPPATTTTSPATGPPSTAALTTTTAPKTTAAPTTTGPIVTAPPTRGEVEDIIREVWPDDLEDKTLEIAWRESGYRAGARNWCCYGLFQIHWSAHKSWLDDLGVMSPTQLLDARTNAQAAYALYLRSGWGPWA